jgi:regulator of protease activity HflC (stomatin/prohibitin superfamily)
MADTKAPDTKAIALNATKERAAETSSGYLLLVLLLVALAADIYGIGRLSAGPNITGLAIVAVATLVFILILPGFYMLQPNQAAAITLFGDYRGTDRTTGLRWTWPWKGKRKVSVRANNFISEKIKVNDLRGNPIDMAAQIMWRVIDTAQALFDVDDYRSSSGSRWRRRSAPSARVIPMTISSTRK